MRHSIRGRRDAEIKDGFMIAVPGGVTQIGTTDIVVLNKGERDGLEVGQVLAIYQAGALVFDDHRPGKCEAA